MHFNHGFQMSLIFPLDTIAYSPEERRFYGLHMEADGQPEALQDGDHPFIFHPGLIGADASDLMDWVIRHRGYFCVGDVYSLIPLMDKALADGSIRVNS